MQQQRSPHSLVAKEIRETLKSYNIPANISSSKKTVTVTLKNQSPEVLRKVQDFCAKFEMSDDNPPAYEQVKYMFVTVDFDDEIRQQVIDTITAYHGVPTFPFKTTAWDFNPDFLNRRNLIDVMWGVLRGAKTAEHYHFWRSLKPKVRIVA